MVALDSSDSVRLVCLLLGAAAFILVWIRGKGRMPGILRTALLRLSLYVALCQPAAFLVDRAARSFNDWFHNQHAGVSVGMSAREAAQAVNRRAAPRDAPYIIDSSGPNRFRDIDLEPRGLARFHMLNRLMNLDNYTVSVIISSDSRIVSIETLHWDPRADVFHRFGEKR